MRYTVKCNECGRDFVAEAENYGTMKYRCPYCGNVLTCRFDPPKPSRTRARAVVPLVDVTPVQAKKMKDMPTCSSGFPSCWCDAEECHCHNVIMASQVSGEVC